MSNFNTLSTFGLIIIFNFIYSINGQTLCPASNCPDKSFCADKDDGNYQNPQDDQTCFISCVAKQSLYCMSCPGNLVYDPASDSCDYPPTATNEQPQGFKLKVPIRRLLNGEDGSNCPDKSFCTGKSYGNYQNPVGHPQTYYISCDMAGNLYCMSCPANLVYDATSDRCEYPSSKANQVNQPASINMAEQTETKDGEEPNAINGNDGESSVTATNEQETASIVMAQQSETEGDVDAKAGLPKPGDWGGDWGSRRLIDETTGNDGSDATTTDQQPKGQQSDAEPNGERGWSYAIIYRRLIDAITGNGDESDATTADQEGDEEPQAGQPCYIGCHGYCCF